MMLHHDKKAGDRMHHASIETQVNLFFELFDLVYIFSLWRAAFSFTLCKAVLI
jgi:hypothetical protein